MTPLYRRKMIEVSILMAAVADDADDPEFEE
jgi:hypothetical protein